MAKKISDLPIGAKVKDLGTTYYGRPIEFMVIDQNHTGYPTNSTTLITDKVITIKSFDGKEPSNTDANRRLSGNNRYSLSNIRQWLNKSGSPWFIPTHSADTMPNSTNVSYNPYDTESGFLSNFSTNFKNILLDTTLTVAKNTVTDGGGSETVIDKIFLLSNTEVGVVNENSIVEGTLFSYFNNDVNRQCYITTEAVSNSPSNVANSLPVTKGFWWWELRSPSVTYSQNYNSIDYNGKLAPYTANGSAGTRPALNISSTTLVSDMADVDGCYILFDNSPPPKIKDIITRLQDIQMLNGKSEITNVLGSPFTNTDNPIQIVNKIQSIKNTMATNLTNKGVNSIGTETLNGLANKIGNISLSSLGGKKWASGTIAVNGWNIISSNGNQYFDFDFLTFTPSILYATVYGNFAYMLKGQYSNNSYFKYEFVNSKYRLWNMSGSGINTSTTWYAYE